LNNLDTDDLVDFINNRGSKKEDLKKGANTASNGISPQQSSSTAQKNGSTAAQ